jgi:hypothetical protein
VKRLLAILSCLLFVGQMFAAQTMPNCAAQTVHTCACCCGGTCGMKCCAAKSDSNSPLPATPAPANSQNQFFIFALATLALPSTPLDPTRQNFSSATQFLAPDAVPIFQRNCAILI